MAEDDKTPPRGSFGKSKREMRVDEPTPHLPGLPPEPKPVLPMPEPRPSAKAAPLTVKSAVQFVPCTRFPWGGVELTLSDGRTVDVGHDVIQNAPWGKAS